MSPIEYDLLIVGAGPAGMAAAIYAARANQKVLVIEKYGEGNLWNAHKIYNYPGFENGVNGEELYDKMKKQAQKFGAIFEDGIFLEIDEISEPKTIKTDKKSYKAYAVIIATGMNKKSAKKHKGEEEFSGRGVSYCAACDGAFFKDYTVAVFGNGEEAAEEALSLSQNAAKIYFFVNEKTINAEKNIIDMIEKNEKIEIVLDTYLEEIKGNNLVEAVVVKEKTTNILKEYKVEGAFLYLGTKSNFELYSTFAKLDEYGAIVTNEKMETLSEGIYAAGDIRQKSVRQITTAVADGTIAALEALKYIMKIKKH